MKLKNLLWLWISVVVIILDQATKFIIQQQLPLGQYYSVTKFFNIVHAQNFGAAFSFLDIAGGQQRWLFALFSLLVSIGLIVWLARTGSSGKWQRAGLALLIGGALGNFCDRFSVGYVTDFLDFHWYNTHWPAFNVADSAVCVGAAILILSIGWRKK